MPLGTNTTTPLEEDGQQFSVTRECIRQIEAKALRKLKHPSRGVGSFRAFWTTDPAGHPRESGDPVLPELKWRAKSLPFSLLALLLQPPPQS